MRHSLWRSPSLFLLKILKMVRNHKIIYFVQFFLLIAIIGVFSFAELSNKVVLLSFCSLFFTELFLVHQTTKIKPDEIFYRKGCFFALGDLAAAFTYMVYFFIILGAQIFKYSFEYSVLPLIALFLYTLNRKIFIYKNLFYEK